MFNFFKKIFGTSQQRQIKKYNHIVKKINFLEKDLQSLSDEAIKAKTAEFKQRYQQGAALEELLPEAYAVVKNTCRRLCGTEIDVSGYAQEWDMVPYDVQILGAIAMHYGYISEMQTGEGKTLTASMPLYLNALSGQPVHLVTVNDYLAQRDCDWIGSIFRWLGLTTEALTGDTYPFQRKAIYNADVVYGTSSEFGFDYLRDHSSAMRAEEVVQRGHYFAIIDEVDSVLIDEARTPLIISGPSAVSRQMYSELREGVSELVKLQWDFCNKLATDAKKKIEHAIHARAKGKVSKQDGLVESNAYKDLWLVGKGTPRNNTLRRLLENPDIRSQIEKWDIYFYGEQVKEEKSKTLSQLFIVVDERGNDFELTDKGISAWSKIQGEQGQEDFIMLDLGGEYHTIDQNVDLTEQEKLEKKVALREEDAQRKERAHNIRQLLRAHLLMEKDIDYIIENEKIVIVDENTGRPQPGRRFSDGLHQALEAKENVPIQRETQTYATVTLQNYFRMYKKLAGMSGTAITEAKEFKEIYNLDVLQIPTNKPCIRIDQHDKIFMTEREKYGALIQEIRSLYDKGQPILIGTESVDVSEKLSRILKQHAIPHNVLNAKHNEQEAEIIAQAGHVGSITISTNMAGRGTDIKLFSGAAELGGLHVIGTTRHPSRRIDRQLRGRSARCGDPGSSQFYVSFEDQLMRMFNSPSLTTMLQRFRPPEGEPISAPMLDRAVETAQKRVEQKNYMIRKHTLEYDNVMNKQRQEVYRFRDDLLQSQDLYKVALEILETTCSMLAAEYFSSRSGDSSWDPEGYRQRLMEAFPIYFPENYFDKDNLEIDDIEKMASEKVCQAFLDKIHAEEQDAIAIFKDYPEEIQKTIHGTIRYILLNAIDSLWQEHLLSMDHLRAEVQVRSLGQKDPLIEYKQEAFKLFEAFGRESRIKMIESLFKTKFIEPIKAPPSPSFGAANFQLNSGFFDRIMPFNIDLSEDEDEA